MKPAKKVRFRERWDCSVGEFILDVAWSPRGDRLAFVTVEGRVFLADADAGGAVRELGAHAGGATSVSWRHDGQEFATSGQDGHIRIWDPANAALRHELPAGGKWVAKVSYQPGRNLLASAADKVLRVWSGAGETREEGEKGNRGDKETAPPHSPSPTLPFSVVYESRDHASTIADIAWNRGGDQLGVAAYNGLTLHAPQRGGEPRKLAWKGSSLVLAWSPTSHYVATGEQDSTVHFWHVKSGEDSQMWGFPTKVLELAWHRTGDHLATGGSDTIVWWDCRGKGPEGRKPKMFEGHPSRLRQLAFQDKGDLLASGDESGLLYLWNPLRGSKPLGGYTFGSAISRIAWSPDDRLLAVGQDEGTLVVLDFR